MSGIIPNIDTIDEYRRLGRLDKSSTQLTDSINELPKRAAIQFKESIERQDWEASTAALRIADRLLAGQETPVSPQGRATLGKSLDKAIADFIRTSIGEAIYIELSKIADQPTTKNNSDTRKIIGGDEPWLAESLDELILKATPDGKWAEIAHYLAVCIDYELFKTSSIAANRIDSENFRDRIWSQMQSSVSLGLQPVADTTSDPVLGIKQEIWEVFRSNFRDQILSQIADCINAQRWITGQIGTICSDIGQTLTLIEAIERSRASAARVDQLDENVVEAIEQSRNAAVHVERLDENIEEQGKKLKSLEEKTDEISVNYSRGVKSIVVRGKRAIVAITLVAVIALLGFPAYYYMTLKNQELANRVAALEKAGVAPSDPVAKGGLELDSRIVALEKQEKELSDEIARIDGNATRLATGLSEWKEVVDQMFIRVRELSNATRASK